MKKSALVILSLLLIWAAWAFTVKKTPKKHYDVAAFFWPAYHFEPRMEKVFPEKKGEWEIIYHAKPKEPGEKMPRVPLWGYEDESDPKVMAKKIKVAVDYGVNVFIFDWYWYDNQPMFEDCIDNGFLKAKNRDKIKFYIMWANHNATSYWDPKSVRKDSIYWKGGVDRPTFNIVVDRIISKYFKQPNYYKINGEPVFCLYELQTFIDGLGGPEQARAALDYFRKKTVEAGFPGLYLQAIVWAQLPKTLSGVPMDKVQTQSSVLNYFGFNSTTNYTWTHLVIPSGDYEAWADKATAMWPHFDKDFSIPYFPNISVGWDPNAREIKEQKYITNSTPEKFEKYAWKAKAYLDAHPDQPQLVTVNSWDEWSEGSYLEPDTTYKMGYLDVIKKVFKQ